MSNYYSEHDTIFAHTSTTDATIKKINISYNNNSQFDYACQAFGRTLVRMLTNHTSMDFSLFSFNERAVTFRYIETANIVSNTTHHLVTRVQEMHDKSLEPEQEQFKLCYKRSYTIIDNKEQANNLRHEFKVFHFRYKTCPSDDSKVYPILDCKLEFFLMDKPIEKEENAKATAFVTNKARLLSWVLAPRCKLVEIANVAKNNIYSTLLFYNMLVLIMMLYIISTHFFI